MGRIKNIQMGKDALSGPQDVGERVSPFVTVPGTDRRRCEWRVDAMASKPNDQRGVDKADERRRAFNGFLFTGGRIRKPEQLLEVAKADFDPPASSVSLKDRRNRDREVSSKENAERDFSTCGRDDDHSDQTSATGAVPLGVKRLVANGMVFAVSRCPAGQPWTLVVRRKPFRLGQGFATHTPTTGQFLLTRGGSSGQDRVGTHRAEHDDPGWEVMQDSVVAIGRVHGEVNSPLAGPRGNDVYKLAG